MDSPPISMIDAPAAAIALPAAIALAGPRLTPPSEKLSGVTFSTAIKCDRPISRPAKCGRATVKSSMALLAIFRSSARAKSCSQSIRLATYPSAPSAMTTSSWRKLACPPANLCWPPDVMMGRSHVGWQKGGTFGAAS